MTSAIVHYFTSWTNYREFCRQKYPIIPEGRSVLFYENCALAHINFAKTNHLVVEGYPHRIFKDFDDLELSKFISETCLKWAAKIILSAGFVFYILGIKLNESTVPWFVATFNLILSIPYLYDPTIRVGGDYIAYI